MECKNCGKTYALPACPHCGGQLGEGVCPECLGSQPLVCSSCGQTVELQRKAPVQPGPVQAAGAFQPPVSPYAQPGPAPAGDYQGYTPPTEKVKLGGWLIVFVVFNAAMLVYGIYGLFSSIFSSQVSESVGMMPGSSGMITMVFTVVFSLAVNILPTVVMLYYVYDRNPKFKSWYTAIVIIQIVLLVISVGSTVLTIAMMPMLEQTMAQAGASAAAIMPEVSVPALVVGLVVSAVLTIIYILFRVYIKKSARVSQTFDPLNNPPKI